MKKIKILVLIITGLFFITSCSKDDELDQTTNDYPSLGTIKFYNNVVNLDNQSNTSLTQITNTTLTLNETTQISSVKVNDFLIGAPSTLCPTGFLRKVLSITKNGQIYTFNTQYATLDEVIEECNISEIITNNVFNKTAQTASVSTSFDVILFDGDANTSTENDQAKITGSLELTPKLIFEMKKKKGESLKSGYIKAGVEFELQKTFDFNCKTSLANFEVDKPFGNELRGPTFLIGGVIWVTPTLKFSVGMKGGVSANMKVGTQETSTYKIFKEMNNGAFTDVQFEKSYTPNSLNLDFTGNASAEVYLKAKYSLKVYEVLGLNVSSKIYLKGDANVSASNLTQVNYCTKWGLKGAAGVDVNVFGSDILSAEIENQLYEAPLPTILGVNPCGVLTIQNEQVTDNSNYVYNSVSLNGRLWLKENWRIGDKLWNNNIQYGSFTMFGSNLSNLPSNWRLPTKTEFENLINDLGSSAFSVLTSTTGFNAKPYGNVYEQNTSNPTETNGEFNNKAIFLSSTLDVYTGGNGPIYYTNCLVIDFVTQTVTVQSLLSSVVGNVNYQKNYYNVRLIKN